MVLEKTLGSSLDCKEIKPDNPKGNQAWAFIGRTDAEAEAPVFWLPDAKIQLIGKEHDAGEGWTQNNHHPQELEKEQTEVLGTGRHVNRKEGEELSRRKECGKTDQET